MDSETETEGLMQEIVGARWQKAQVLELILPLFKITLKSRV